MAKKRILSTLLSVMLLTPLIKVKAIEIPASKPRKGIESDRNLNLRNYEVEQVEELVEAEFEKRKEIELEEQKKREIEEQKLENKKQYWKFEVSYYCGCYYCTQNGNLITASGEYAQEGVTIALPQDIPFGSKVHIDDVGDFIVQDRGGYIEYTYDEEGNLIMRVDVYIENHDRALQLGRHIKSGYIIIN